MTVRSSNILLLAVLAALLMLAYLVETMIPQVTLVSIKSPRLKSFFSGRVVAHISDQHLVKFGWRDQLVVSALEKIRPDIIFMTGDYLEPRTDFNDLEKYLRQLRAIAPIVAIPGNNDYCCIKRLDTLFSRCGIVFLKNQTAFLHSEFDSLYVVGMEDNFLWQDDYFRAAAAVPPGASRIVLGHAPAIVEKIDPDGVELILSGHLHGGQIILPFYGPVARNTVCFVSRMYTAGVYQFNGMTLYSNRGTGTSLVPLRFLSRPEIAVLEFTD